MIKIVRLCGIRKINAGLKEKKKDCGPCERGGSTRATLLVPLKRRPPLETPTYKTRNMVVARATLVDTRRAAIMPFRIAEREQGPPSSSSSSSLSSTYIIIIDWFSISRCWVKIPPRSFNFETDIKLRILKFKEKSRCVRRYYDTILWKLQDSSTFER